MRSVRRVGEAGTHPTSTDHVSGPIQTASNGETVGKNQVNSYASSYTAVYTVPGTAVYSCVLGRVLYTLTRPARIVGIILAFGQDSQFTILAGTILAGQDYKTRNEGQSWPRSSQE